MAHRPVIGVTSYARDSADPPRFSLPCGYIDSVRGAGAVPLLLPPGERNADAVLDVLDGLILAGGGDISPAAYGGQPHETVYSVCEERDEFEFALARGALARPDLPVLCICRGMQVLNVISGGTLHEHLPLEFGDRVPHRLPPRLTSRHPIRIQEGSRLADMMGTTATEVLSWHHQGLDDVAEALRPVAWADDGVIEAVEHTGHPWCIGVQWHPEMQPGEVAQERLFEALVRAVADRRR